MSFSRKQQPEFRALVAAAWLAHCRQQGFVETLKPGREWYEEELFLATGQRSTGDCNAGRDYDRAMAHFEGLGGGGIRWQMRLHSGDAVRLLHELRAEVAAWDVDEDYLRGVARRMLQRDDLPALEELSRRDLIVILGEVKRWARRRAKAERLDEIAGDLPEGARVDSDREPF